MKSYALLVFSTLLAVTAVSCSKEETTSNDSDLAGVNVAVGEQSSSYRKLFVLNEGKLNTNNASLDFFRYSDGNYVRNAFQQMNPEQVLGLGDVGNDIQIYKGKLWLVINNSGLVEVVEPENEKHVATVKVPTPRQIAFGDGYAYVTSWSGAAYGSGDRAGAVYKVSTRNYEVTDSVHVGFQPEGIAEADGKLYVANSGCMKSDYSYDDRISVINLGSFEVEKEIKVAKNLQSVIVKNGKLWVSTLGDYYMEQSGIHEVDLASGTAVPQSEALAGVRSSGKMYISGEVLYTFNNIYAADYSVEANDLYAINVATGTVDTERLDGTVKTAYGICVDGVNGDIYIGDAVDYLNPGKVHCFSKDLKLKWSAVAGVDPGHFVLWEK